MSSLFAVRRRASSVRAGKSKVLEAGRSAASNKSKGGWIDQWPPGRRFAPPAGIRSWSRRSRLAARFGSDGPAGAGAGAGAATPGRAALGTRRQRAHGTRAGDQQQRGLRVPRHPLRAAARRRPAVAAAAAAAALDADAGRHAVRPDLRPDHDHGRVRGAADPQRGLPVPQRLHAEPSAVRAPAGAGLPPWRRQLRRANNRGGRELARVPGPHGGRHPELPAGLLRLLRQPRARRRGPSIRQLRPARPAVRTPMGEAEHRRVRRRYCPGGPGRPILRLLRHRGERRVAARRGPVQPRDLRKRRAPPRPDAARATRPTSPPACAPCRRRRCWPYRERCRATAPC